MEPSHPVNYLRMSVTDRCQLRCAYCTYWQDWRALPQREILTYEELLKIARAAAGAGIRKVRITGGEPLVRRGVAELVRDLHQVPGLEKVCLTTNGVLLEEMARPLYDAGLRHLNLSLDTLRPDRYRRITGADHFLKVWEGLRRALELGFHPVKINCVVLKGINEDELLDLALLSREHPLQVRFIELMPTLSRDWWGRHFLPLAAVRRRLEVLGDLSPLPAADTAGPARLWAVPGFKGELGFISPMSQHHCSSCNRLRLTASGRLRPCLLRDEEMDLKKAVRRGADPEVLRFIIQKAMGLKESGLPGHFPAPHHTPSPSMASIGG